MLSAPVRTSAALPSSFQPYLLLAFAALCWAGNFVFARGASAELTPLTLAVGRWGVALMVLAPWAVPRLAAARDMFRAHGGRLVALALFGVAASNTLVYVGLRSTPATHGVLLNALLPLMVAGLAAAVWRKPLSRGLLAGLGVSLAGVLAIVAHGDLMRLVRLDLGAGDLWVLAGLACWAVYTLLLRGAPAADRLLVLWLTVLIGLSMLLPLWWVELDQQGWPAPSLATLGGVVYLGVFPSVLALCAYMKAVAAVGPARAASFLHLIPAFGTLMAALFLGESLAPYHYLGLAAILCGLVLAQRGAARD